MFSVISMKIYNSAMLFRHDQDTISGLSVSFCRQHLVSMEVGCQLFCLRRRMGNQKFTEFGNMIVFPAGCNPDSFEILRFSFTRPSLSPLRLVSLVEPYLCSLNRVSVVDLDLGSSTIMPAGKTLQI